jgi:hypothetical protein
MKDRTSPNGSYRESLPDKEGTYRSVVKKSKLADDDVCKAMCPGVVNTTTPKATVAEVAG